MSICFLYISLYWEWRRPSFILKLGDLEVGSYGISQGYIHFLFCKNLLFPILYGSAISPLHILFSAKAYLKSCSSHVTCSRITLKTFQICYYLRKRELKLSESYLDICSCSVNKAMRWLLTNWPIMLLKKCSKQFRNSTPKAAWIF